MDVASTPLLASSFPYGFFGCFMRRGKGRSFFQMVEHFAHVRERVVLSVAHHRVVLALRNLSHIVTLLDLSFSFCHFYLRLFSPRVAEWHKKRPSSESTGLRNGKPFRADS